jgi:hypothetical protein
MKALLPGSLAVLLALSCAKPTAPIADAAPPAPVVADAAASAPLPGRDASPVPLEDAGHAAVAPSPSFEAGDAELRKACAPKGAQEQWLFAMREQEHESGHCMRRIMSRALDKVLIPMKKADPTRFDALMKEQADWNVMVEKLQWMTEEWDLVSPKTGYRGLEVGMGNHGWGGAYVEQEASKERLLYARSLLANETSQLRPRIDSRQSVGRKNAALIQEMNTAAKKFIETPPPEPTEDFTGIADWMTIRNAQTVLGAMVKRLAHSTCTVAFPSLAADYGGLDACEEKLRFYYLAHDRRDGHTPQ